MAVRFDPNRDNYHILSKYWVGFWTRTGLPSGYVPYYPDLISVPVWAWELLNWCTRDARVPMFQDLSLSANEQDAAAAIFEIGGRSALWAWADELPRSSL